MPEFFSFSLIPAKAGQADIKIREFFGLIVSDYKSDTDSYIPEKRITRHYNVTYRNYTIQTKCSKCGNTNEINGQELISQKTTFYFFKCIA